jgi:hypothetical protein
MKNEESNEETVTLKFKGCEHLDFNPNYSAKRQQTVHGLFWMRERSPQMVQFCKKRGRINGCVSCLSEADKGCNDYSEKELVVELTILELES